MTAIIRSSVGGLLRSSRCGRGHPRPFLVSAVAKTSHPSSVRSISIRAPEPKAAKSGRSAATWLTVTSIALLFGLSSISASAATDEPALISMEEVERHNSLETGIWVVIEGNVYDLTTFVARHPGGAEVILRNAGKDVTDVYVPVHPSDAIQENLSADHFVGKIDPATVKAKEEVELSERQLRQKQALENLPPVSSILNLDEFERVAHSILTDQAWAYYCSAADDEISKHQNRSAYARVWFRPRILRKVLDVDPSAKMLDIDVALPLYVSPSAMAKLGHPLGEVNLTRAAGKAHIVQGISANASCSLSEILEARVDPSQTLFYQLYVNKDRAASEKILRRLETLPAGQISAVMLTVDAAIMGNRESDARAKGAALSTGGETDVDNGGRSSGGKGVGEAISGYIDPNLDWSAIKWYRRHCSLPLILKGIQCVEDVELAAENGVQGVVLSNHGGRSLDFAPAPIDVLIELQQRRPDLLQKMDVYVDGGVRRGTDVLKALALGAKAVGLGRPFLFAQSGFGEAGATRAIEILRKEIENGMRLLGISSLDQLTPQMVDVLPRTFDPYLLHRKAEREREYPFEHEQEEQRQQL